MTESNDKLSIVKFGLELELKQLAQQKSDLAQARNHASVSIAMSGLTATVFASMLPKERIAEAFNFPVFLGLGPEPLLVLFLFAASSICSAKALVGVTGVKFDHSFSETMLQFDYWKNEIDTLQVLALETSKWFDENEIVIRSTQNYVWFAVVFAVAQIPAWLVWVF